MDEFLWKQFKPRTDHALLSPSQHWWLGYDDEKLAGFYQSSRQATIGTELHKYAELAIRRGITQARKPETLNMYINDCIGYGLVPEQRLEYDSKYCWGTADAIGFDVKKQLLRVFDLKTGLTKVIPSDMDQLRIYAALFCHDYHYDPFSIRFVLRLYKNDAVIEDKPDPGQIREVMDRIVYCVDFVKRQAALFE